MTAPRVRLRGGAVVWQQITRCEPELEVVVAVAGEVERWGEGLPLATRALATAHAGDRAFTLIAVPGIGCAWVASSALQPGEADADVVLTEATTAYATRARCEWEASTAPALDERHGDWVEVDRGAQADWVFVRRLRHGQPAGPLSRIAPGDVVERWHPDDRNATAEADARDAEDGPTPPGSPEPAAPESIETLLRFLRLGAADGDAALEIASAPRAASTGATTGSDDAAVADRTRLPWLEDAMPPTEVESATADVAPVTPSARVTTLQPAAPQPVARSPVHAAVEVSDAGLARNTIDAPVSVPVPIATSAAPAAAAGAAARTAGPSATAAPPNQLHAAHPAVPGASRALPSSINAVPTPGTPGLAPASGPSAAPVAPSAPSERTPSSSTAVPLPSAPPVQVPSSNTAAPVPRALPAQPAPSHDTRPVPSAPRAQVPASNDEALPPGALPAHTPASSAAAPAPSAPSAWRAPPGSAPPAPSPASSPAPGAAGVPQVRTSSSDTGAQDAPHGSPGAARSARIVSAVRGNVDLPDGPSAAPAPSRAPHASPGPSQPAPATPRPPADDPRPPAPAQSSPTRGSTPPAVESTTAAPGIAPHARLDSEATTATAARSSSDAMRATHTGDAAALSVAAGPAIAPGPRPPEPSRTAEAVDSPARAVDATPPRGRVATARRGADDLGLPAHPAPAPDGEAAPAASPRSLERSRRDRPSGPAARAPTAAPAASVLPPPLASPPSPHAPATVPSRPQPAAVRQPQSDMPSTAGSAPIAHAPSTAAIASSAPVAAATASPKPSMTPAPAPAAHVAPESTRAPVVAGIPTPRTTPMATAADPRPRAAESPPHDVPAGEGTSVASVARAHETPVLPLASRASREVNREIRIGDVVVELGEPLPPHRTIERAGSLLASLPRPSLRPRRRL